MARAPPSLPTDQSTTRRQVVTRLLMVNRRRVEREGGRARNLGPYPPFIPSPDAHILFLLFDWEKDASGRYEHKTLINLMKSSSPWLLPGEG